eukprot:2556605-Heterocapsa_arctica.AAC.1
MQLLVAAAFAAHFAASTGVVLWCARTGRLSARTGLPWEGYFGMLTLGSLWCLAQALCVEA